jgi:AraC-like DNA-binding protein
MVRFAHPLRGRALGRAARGRDARNPTNLRSVPRADGERVRVDPTALAVLFSWLLANRRDLSRSLRTQANVIREGPIGFLLTGLLPVARWTLPYAVHFDPVDAFRSVSGDAGVALAAEVDAIAERIRGVSREVRVTRELLERDLDTRVEQVAGILGISSRSLQRALMRSGTSFHAEVVSARLARAQTLLRESDDKVAAIAATVGVSERGLTQLFRRRTGSGPAEWRKRHR